MKNTILASIVAILCTAAVCVTLAVKAPSENASSVNDNTYMTESEAAEYIGVTDEVMQLMRKNLKNFEGAYVSYYYTDNDGKEINEVVYNKDALDDAVEKIMKEQGALNFKYIQEAADSSK